MTDERPTLRFGWWNTGVAPPWVNSTATLAHRESVAAVIERLIGHERCALLGLAEVRREIILDWVPEAIRCHFRDIRDTSADRNDFDVGLLYDERYLRLLDFRWVRTRYGNQTIRAGLVLRLETLHPHASSTLLVALAHWRSDARNHEDADVRRARAAESLREQIARDADALGGQPAILVLGDFNAEPFSTPLQENLGSTRARDVVRRHSREPNSTDLLLYNPTWRLLGERHPWGATEAPTLAGTYKRENDMTPQAWRTYDQVLVSGDLLGTRGWTLREDRLRLWTSEDVFDTRRSQPRGPFDHLPVLAELEWLAAANVHGSDSG